MQEKITYKKAKENFSAVIDRVYETRGELIITRGKRGSVVMLPLDEYQGLKETAYLLKNPQNARRLLESIAEFDADRATSRQLID